MSITLTALQKQRRDTAANWTTANPTLLAGEIGLESDTGYWKVGDGSTAWTSLAYVSGLGAEIPVSRLADGSARQLLQTAANGTDVEWTSNVDVPGTLDVTGAATFDNNVIIQGDLTVNGNATTIDTTNLAIKDKNIEIGKVATPTDVTANGGGITLKGTTDKTINWIDATAAWTLSEHVNIFSGKEYRIDGTKVLDATSLGSGVVSSSLTSVGTIGTGVWQGTAISDAYLATIGTAGKVSNSATTATSANTASAIVARDASGNFSAGTITANLSGNASTVTTNANLTGDVTSVGNATSIAAGVIVNANVNASAAIAGTKISPDFGNQNITTTGTITAGTTVTGTAFIPLMTALYTPANGLYSPSTNAVAISSNSVGRLIIDSSGNVNIKGAGVLGLSQAISFNGSAPSNSLVIDSSGRLGIGSSTVAGRLQVGTTLHTDNNALVFNRGIKPSITASQTAILCEHNGIGSAECLTFMSDAGYKFLDDTGVSEFARIDTSGRLLVGVSSTSDPQKFTLADGNVALYTSSYSGGETINKTITSYAKNGVFSTLFDKDAEICFGKVDGFDVDYTHGGFISFKTTANNRDVAPAERVRIDSSGGFRVKGAGTAGVSDAFFINGSAPASSAQLDSSGRLLIGTSTARANFQNASVTSPFQIEGTTSSNSSLSLVNNSTGDTSYLTLARSKGTTVGSNTLVSSSDFLGVLSFQGNDGSEFVEAAVIYAQVDGTPGANDMPGRLIFSTTSDGASSPTERCRLDNGGRFTFQRDGFSGNPGYTHAGVSINDGYSGTLFATRDGATPVWINRLTNDGNLVELAQDSTVEGTISVSGTTVSYNGAHLSRWSQLPNGADRTEILRGSVLSNIDEMCEWGDEDNEQLNRMKVSDVEGDKNVSGVFQCWDDDDDTYTNDFYCAMTGDFIIRIAEGVTVERGDLLMSAGDGTAKPQDDDIIRSKTIAKVTSTNVSCTYEDGSYCVPCVLMAC